MKVKVYLREWFFNAGVIGFLRIWEHSKNQCITIGTNFIEFDTKDLKNFHQLYFTYFYDIYNVAEKNAEKIKISFSKIRNNLERESEQVTEKKNIQEKIK